jgi:hypothetical protein
MLVDEPIPETPRYRPIVIVIIIEVTHGVWQPNQSGLAVMLVELELEDALPVQTCSQKFSATPGDALAILV